MNNFFFFIFSLVGFNGISTSIGYLMPEPFYTSIILWCSRYRRRKWTRRHEFKSLTRLIAFHIALIPLGKVLNPIILPSAMGK